MTDGASAAVHALGTDNGATEVEVLSGGLFEQSERWGLTTAGSHPT